MKKIKFFFIIFFLIVLFAGCCPGKKESGYIKETETKLSKPFDRAAFIKKIKSDPVKDLKNYKFDTSSALIDRVSETPDIVINHWKNYDGRKDYGPYKINAEERSIIKESLNLLPGLYKKVLKERLTGIYFINNLWGSGVADYILDDNNNIFIYIIFNPAVLKTSFSSMVTLKENTCFINDNLSTKVAIDCGTKYSGFLYILLHESTHAIDYIKYITPYVEDDIKKIKNISTVSTDFTKGYWNQYKVPIKTNDYPFRNDVTFYGFGKGPKIKISDAETLYRRFSQTSFASIYGSKSWAEDLAEFITFYHLTQVLKQPYMITVYNNDKPVFTYEPMKSEIVRSRFNIIQKFY